jgi:hypothetical protein
VAELGATPDEPPLVDATTPALAIGQHVEAVVDHRGEQLRAPATAVEDDGDSSLADHLPHLAKHARQGLRQRRIDLPSHYQQRIAGAIVDPVVGAGEGMARWRRGTYAFDEMARSA